MLASGKRTATAVVLALAALGWAGSASATEGETDVGGSVGISFLDARSKGVHTGGLLTLNARRGLTDAFDLALELSAGAQPSIDTLLLGVAGGAHYVVDIARFRPHFGLLLGVTDVWTTACETRPSNIVDVDTPRPPLFRCGHDPLPAIVIPLAIEWAPEIPIRIGLAPRLALLPFRTQVPETLVHINLGASFTWIVDDDP